MMRQCHASPRGTVVCARSATADDRTSLRKRATSSAERDPERRAADPTAIAWETLYRAYNPMIRRLARGVSPRDEIDDAAQDVWLTLVLRLPSFRHDPERGALSAWLTTVARHALQRRARRRHGPSTQPLPRDVDCILARADSNPFDVFERQRRRLLVRGALAALRGRVPTLTYFVLLLHWGGGQTMPAIAARLDIGVEQAWARHARGLRILRRLLIPHLSPESVGLVCKFENPEEN